MPFQAFVSAVANRDLLASILAAKRLDDINKEYTSLGRVTLLQYAVFHEMPELVAALIEMGASPHVSDHEGSTMLHHAASRNDVETIRILLDSGLDIDARNNGGYTALACTTTSVSNDRCAAFDALLNAGADPEISDFRQDRPLHHAMSSRNDYMAKALIICMDATDATGDTPLHIAVSLGHLSLVTLLIQAGAKLEIKDRFGRIPLDLAIQKQHKFITAALVKAKASSKEKKDT